MDLQYFCVSFLSRSRLGQTRTDLGQLVIEGFSRAERLTTYVAMPHIYKRIYVLLTTPYHREHVGK
jgi:hypothetical protein